jgi:hypothetical protein
MFKAVLMKSDTPIEKPIKAFAEFGVEATYVVPTETGCSKSIIDAHKSFREFLLAHQFHDFYIQPQGQEAKIKVPVGLICADHIETREMSLYRPNSKDGDPRFWISGLKKYIEPWNLLAFLFDGQKRLYAINCSDMELMNTRNKKGSPLNEILSSIQTSPVAEELLGLLREISTSGFIDTKKKGDTGVGYTLETLLGIPPNSNQTPDYKGIEIKSGRVSMRGRPSTSRLNMFSCVPVWELSQFTESQILNEFGYYEENRFQLYCTVTANPNPRNLFLGSDGDAGFVKCFAEDNEEEKVMDVCHWSLPDLETRLSKKHRETFWVTARSTGQESGIEKFHYVEVQHTKAPLIRNFGPLVKAGHISMDFTLHQKNSGSIRNHGYLWKVAKAHKNLLFPNPVRYDLTAK